MKLDLSYGRGRLSISVPDANLRHVLRFTPQAVLTGPLSATREALADPLGCVPLADLARGRRDACIVTADITRPVPNPVILPAMLEALDEAGLPPERVTILIGTGSHRPNTDDELREMLGDVAMDSGARVVNHDAFAPDELVHLGHTERGTRALVNRLYHEADLKLGVSLVEPHLIAGFSGGRKAICPGICGIETLLRFHAPDLVRPAEASTGVIHGNPAHEESLAVAKLVGAPELMVNATLNEGREVTGIFAGALEPAHLAAVSRSVAQAQVVLDEPVDVAVTCAAGHPLDLTYYQSVKGLSAPLPILKPGGAIVAAFECAEGIGEPDYVRRMMETTDMEAYEPRVTDPTYFHMDQWHAQFTKILRVAADVFVHTTGVPSDQLAQCFVTPVPSVEEGLAQALATRGPDASIAVLPEGPYVLPCLTGDPIHRQRF